jgi:ArsR family transcriptional regulator, lead/cadmium/zinc/bismuth-responsive transcriptional repressor
MENTPTLAEVGELLDEPRTLQSLSELFKVMGDPTRLSILGELLKGEARVSEIAAQLDMSLSAVSHQLGILRMSRLVRWERRGREIHYALDDHHVELLFQAGLDHCCHD